MRYSNDLVLQLQKYWKDRFDHGLSEEIANQYLDSLANLYLTFVKSNKEEKK